MSLSVGIVGLPNVGKSTLFNALLKKRVALSANYPFATIEPNIGVVEVPDGRLAKLAELVKSEEKMENLPPVVSAVVQFIDIAGLVKGAHQGAGLGNQFLGHIREVDAIIHVLRDFNDEGVVREGSEDPKSDQAVVETELALADLTTVEKLITVQEKQVRATNDALEITKLEVLSQLKGELENGRIIGDYTKGEERIKKWFEKLPLLLIKPMLLVFNVSEEEYAARLKMKLASNQMVIAAKLEEELADYSDEERREYLSSLGIQMTGLERLIIKAYELLGLISFLTAGKKEVRAWTLRCGETALRASGVIHTDFMKNFIRAQVIAYEKLIEAGSYAEAKLKGLIRTEGKDYIVQDGEVVEFMVGR